MIGYLKGTLAAKRPPSLTVEVGGVGYELAAPMSTFYRLPEVGQPLTLITHLVIREDAHTLYGFSTESERELFRSLIRVSGVGARMALAVLSGMTVEGFYDCIRAKDMASLVRLPGIGRKTAERLLLEMADRLPAEILKFPEGTRASATPAGEAQEALLALGYKASEIDKMLKGLDTAKLSTEELIREALRRVHKNGAKP